jgi:hypothetical protein
MDTLTKKLNFKDTNEILVLNLTNESLPNIESFILENNCIFEVDNILHIEFALIFVLTQKDINDALTKIYSKFFGDCIIWFCYPKKSSKKYKSDINRDHGWEILGAFGFEPVRQIAIDEDFSALRFRKVEFIKKITRSKDMALTETAKNRTSKQEKQ